MAGMLEDVETVWSAEARNLAISRWLYVECAFNGSIFHAVALR